MNDTDIIMERLHHVPKLARSTFLVRRAIDSIVASRRLDLPIDETSLLFSTPEELAEFVDDVRMLGLDHFNRVGEDPMRRQGVPIAESFLVRFEFLRIPGENWRIEAMCKLAGRAPLHEEFIRTRGSGSVVHLSYKPTDYLDGMIQLHQKGDDFVAEYRNSYGQFSYWRRGRIDPYIKPRVNLRDMS